MHFFLAWFHLGHCGWRATRSAPARWWRLPLVLVLWLLLGLLGLMHWVGFALDEVLFRGYRRLTVRSPVFVLGVPRSGTTALQRQLARDPAFTSLTLRECLLAPSICERYFWSGVGRLVKPLWRRLPRWRAMEGIHQLGWQEPEEDFLLLLHRGGCFLPALLDPGADRYWRLAFFDQAVPAPERRRLLRFYYRCVQRHLYFHGGHRRLLSKNPSWTGWMGSLSECFPDARFVACVRRPGEAVPSQLSALRPALSLFGRTRPDPALQERLLTVLHHYYRQLRDWRTDPRVRCLPQPVLARMDTAGWHSLYAFLGQPLPNAAPTRSSSAPVPRPGHRYRAEEFGLSETALRQRFADVWTDPIPEVSP